MKLYFYILDKNRKYDVKTGTFEKAVFKMKIEECEVIEKPKTYRAVTKFPKGIYRGYIKKEDIGRIADFYGEYVVLEKPNYQFAKEVFLKKYNREINALRDKISTCEDIVAAIENFKDD